MQGLIYAICYREFDEEKPFYIGRTRKTLEQRFQEHRKGALDPLNPKPAYEFIRASNLTDEFYITKVCDEGELTEAEVVRAAILDGHKIFNATSGDSVVPKARSKSTFGIINREALACEASTRRNRLHNDAQTLSKPEIVAQRITGAFPDAATLNAMDWRSAPVEAVPWGKLPKNIDGITCEMLKYGDLLIYVLIKPGHCGYWIKNTRTVLANAYKFSWEKGHKLERLQVLERICRTFPSFTWWPLSARDPLQ